MNKNIRRSIAVAAGAAGMWAVGTATASADELPSLSLSTADKAADSVEDTAAEVTEAPAAAAGKGKAAAATATATAATTTATAGQAEGAVREGAQASVRTTADQARQYAESEVAEAGDEIDYLFGPLSSFAPELVDRAPATVQGHARGAVAHATPVAEEAAQDVLPPIAGRAADGVLPVAGQAVGDAGGLAAGVVADVEPFAGGVLSGVQPFAGNVAGEVQPFAGGVVGSVQPLVETVVDHVQPVTHGVGGSAGDLAHGVVGDVTPFAGGVASGVRPFTQDVYGTVAASPAVGNAAAGVQGAADTITPGYADSLGRYATQGF
ncbi:hypothetical protein [Streptomyces marianii]|uniref:ATP-binding protein n=1 Tax=Streptomyces marianii TaxID=1817406 RepID=A0A5R9E2N4_9ACTN|nr:hypothetical protein [Streptomyces marianii]TLQ44188.1 hypothetical protein FEF34_14600 [Streptomyces marianii]